MTAREAAFGISGLLIGAAVIFIYPLVQTLVVKVVSDPSGVMVPHDAVKCLNLVKAYAEALESGNQVVAGSIADFLPLCP